MNDWSLYKPTYVSMVKQIIRKSFVKENGLVDWTKDKLGLDKEVLGNFSSFDDIFPWSITSYF